MAEFLFSQVNVFSSQPLGGNPLAVVHEASPLNAEQMAALARWTNLSETTFLLPPTDPAADYRVRIFSPSRELPFAGHPTLGSCHAWLAAGGTPKQADVVIQECEAGLVRVRRNDAQLAFEAPPLLRSGPLESEVVEQIARALSIDPAEIVAHQWADNGPGWCAVLLQSAEQVLALKPDWATLDPLNLGVIGAHEPGHDSAFEVRSFVGRAGYEDPVTGSLNASLAQWLIGAGVAEAPYIASQGTVLNRVGRISLAQEGDAIWVGGLSTEVIRGSVQLEC